MTRVTPRPPKMANALEGPDLFNIVNGTDFHEEIKTFTELKPVRLPFQDDFLNASQESYSSDLQNYAHHGGYNNELQQTFDWINEKNAFETQVLTAECVNQTEIATFESQYMCNPAEQTISESQPICNQEFFCKLDEILINLPRDLYVEQLVDQTNNCEETIAMYRSILAQKARMSEKCPNGPLYTRRTTKLETSSKRYANDCYALQSFIDNDDPKVLSEIIVKKRNTIKSEPAEQITPVIGLSSLKIEIAELKSEIMELKSTVYAFKSEQTKDKAKITALEKCVSELTEKIRTTNKQPPNQVELTETVLNRNAKVPSLFENIRREKQIEENSTVNSSAKSNAPTTNKSQNKPDGGKQPNQNDNKDETTNPKSIVCPDKKDQNFNPKNDNKKCTMSENDTDKSASNDLRPLPSNASKSQLNGNYVEAVKSNLQHNNINGTESNATTKQTDQKRVGNRDLYLYFTEEGLPRFGRPVLSSQTISIDDNLNSTEKPMQTIESNYDPPPNRIPVLTTYRNENKNQTKTNQKKATNQHQNLNQNKKCMIPTIQFKVNMP